MQSEWSYDIIAPIYDFDMGLNMPFDDLAGYLELLPGTQASLLEIGCGTGRLTLPLADQGYSVTAIDRSEPMLEQLRNKLSPGQDIKAILMDARNIDLAGPFDAVFFAYSGFQYLLDDLEIGLFCKKVKRILTADGFLILDIFLHQRTNASSSYILDYERKLTDGRVLSRRKQLGVNNDVNTVRRKYSVQGEGEWQQYQTESRQRLYSVDQLVTKLQHHGFKLDIGMFDYRPHTCDTGCCHRFYTARFIPS